MSYSEVATIKSLFPQIKDGDTDGLLTKAITRAYNLINAALVSRYSVPFATGSVPPMITSISDDLVVFFCKRTLTPGTGSLDDESRNMYKEAIKELQDIQLGKMTLVDSAGARITENTTISSNTSSYSPIFNLDDWNDQVIDEDRLDAIEEGRE